MPGSDALSGLPLDCVAKLDESQRPDNNRIGTIAFLNQYCALPPLRAHQKDPRQFRKASEAANCAMSLRMRRMYAAPCHYDGIRIFTEAESSSTAKNKNCY